MWLLSKIKKDHVLDINTKPQISITSNASVNYKKVVRHNKKTHFYKNLLILLVHSDLRFEVAVSSVTQNLRG